MAKVFDRDMDSPLDSGSWKTRLKRGALLVSIPMVVLLVLFLILWNTFFKYVPPGSMLVVLANTGDPLDPGEQLAKPGQKGTLEEVRGEGWHFIMPILYSTSLAPNIVIKPGMIGVMTAKGGKNIPPKENRQLAEDGEQGILREVLLPGTYRINPQGYSVTEEKMTEINPGFVGVVQRLLASKNGPTGILPETLQPGLYAINPKEYKVTPCEVGIYQTTYSYNPANKGSTAITFPAKDGNEIKLDCTIEWELKAEYWPDWLETLKSLKNIETVVVDQHARKICRDRGLNYGAQDFLDGTKREKFQDDFQTELGKSCKKHNVIIRSAFIRNIIIPDNFLEQKRQEQLAVETRLTNVELTKTEETNAEVAEAKETIELKKQKVQAETEKLTAAIDREAQTITDITKAELEKMKDEYSAKISIVDAERTKVLGESQAEAKKLKETAEASLFKMKMDVFGRDSDAYLRYTLAKELNPQMKLRLFQAGAGTLWTNMGNKDMNFMMPLSPGSSGSPERSKTER